MDKSIKTHLLKREWYILLITMSAIIDVISKFVHLDVYAGPSYYSSHIVLYKPLLAFIYANAHDRPWQPNKLQSLEGAIAFTKQPSSMAILKCFY